METADEIVAVTEGFENLAADAGHDCHVENNVDTVGEFDTDFGERRTDSAHGERNDVHCSSFHGTLIDTFEQFVGFVFLHPVVGGTCVFFFFGADESTAFHTCDVVDCGTVEIATGEQFLIELNHFAGGHSLFSERLELFFGTVDKNDLIGGAKRDAVVHELLDSFVVKFHYYLRSGIRVERHPQIVITVEPNGKAHTVSAKSVRLCQTNLEDAGTNTHDAGADTHKRHTQRTQYAHLLFFRLYILQPKQYKCQHKKTLDSKLKFSINRY